MLNSERTAGSRLIWVGDTTIDQGGPRATKEVSQFLERNAVFN